MNKNVKKIIVITGPTAVGKTKMSIELAKYFNGEIINADSTQIFRGLNIATAKVSSLEQEGIKHHLIDIKNIDENYTVYDYQKDCREKINDILSINKTPILVGGTGLYIKAALYNYEFEKEGLSNSYEEISSEDLYNRLLEIDPNTDIHINNRKRVVRALNYYELNNEIISEKIKTDELLYDTIFIGLTTSRDVLYERINRRVDLMIENKLIDEASIIYNKNIRTKAVMTPIGYKELFEYFDNTNTLDESIQLIKQRSRNYAKKQYTWFNNQMELKWFNVDFDNFSNTIEEVINYIEGR